MHTNLLLPTYCYYWTKMLQSLLNAIRHLHRPWKTAIFKKRQHSLADLSIYMCVPFLKIAICFPGASSKDIKKCKKKQQQIDKNKNPPSSEFLLVLGEREIGLQHRPTHTNFTLFVLLLVAVAWHVAANARLHKYEYISLSLFLVVPADCSSRRPCYHTFTP